MPLYLYRLEPALAVAFAADYRSGEWILELHARSEAMSVGLILQPYHAEALSHDLLRAADAFAGGPFPLGHLDPVSITNPLLLTPLDLEAIPTGCEVLRHPHRRLLGIRAQGQVEGAPFRVEVWGTPEQLLALAQQIHTTLEQVRARCPICGGRRDDEDHRCPAGSVAETHVN